MAYKVIKPRFTKRYVRYRIEEPSKFRAGSFRMQDIGRKGHSKRIAGQLRKSGKWKTQAILIAKGDYKEGTRVAKTKGRAVIVKV
jgi:hypothetical protein